MSEFVIGTGPTSVQLWPCHSLVCYDQRSTAHCRHLISLIFIRRERYSFMPVYDVTFYIFHSLWMTSRKKKKKESVHTWSRNVVTPLSSKCPWVPTCATLFVCPSQWLMYVWSRFHFLTSQQREYFRLFWGRTGGWCVSLFSLGAQDRIEVHEMN